MRNKKNTAVFSTASIFIPACSIFLFASVVLVGCSGAGANNAATATGAAGSVSGSGSDMYYEYTTTTTGTTINMNGYQKLYVSSGGGVRSEMQMGARTGVNDRSGLIVLIASEAKPNQSISLDDSAKTYTVNNIDTTLFSAGNAFKMESTVTKVGEEKIMGFNSIHARVISTRSMGPMGKMSDTLDIWNSPDVPLAPFFRKYWDQNMSRSWSAIMSASATDQLKQMGCTGFMLKMQTGSKDASVRMELTKIEKGDFPVSLFTVPAGYKETKE